MGSRRGRLRAGAKASLVLGVSVGVAGCGAAARTPARAHASRPAASPPPCSARASTTLARSAAIAVQAIAAAPFAANNGAPSCRFRAGKPATRALEIVAELDGAPQAYYRFEKHVEEFAQSVIWFHLGEHAYPRPIPHLGLGADWFPTKDQLVTTDGARLITITVVSSSEGARERIAEDLARSYLRSQ